MLLLVYLLTYCISVEGRYYRFEDCNNFNSEIECINNQICKWCNSSAESVMCTPIYPCEKQIDTCSYNSNFNYELECNIVSVLYFLFMTVGFYISIIIIYGTTRNLLLNENVSDRTIYSINTIIFLIMALPLILTFIFKPIIFGFLFLSYFISSMCILGCVKIKNNDKSLYTTIKS